MAPWPVMDRVYAMTTTRQSSFKDTEVDVVQCADHIGNNSGDVQHHRRLLESALELSSPIQWLHQVHGQNIIHIRPGFRRRNVEADACVSSFSGQACVIQTADCLPVFFYDKYTHRVAVAHAGWRGLAAGVLENTLLKLGGRPEAICISFGPGISQQCFEVGAEVRQKFIAVADNGACISEIKQAFIPSPNNPGRWLADLYFLARIRLQFAGIPACNIHSVNYCTYRQDKYFYSYRREGNVGRLISIIFTD